jgi:hypothetical protein
VQALESNEAVDDFLSQEQWKPKVGFPNFRLLMALREEIEVDLPSMLRAILAFSGPSKVRQISL